MPVKISLFQNDMVNFKSKDDVLTLAYLTAKRRYMVVREMPAGRGFADLVFVPKRGNPDPAMEEGY